MIDSRFSTRLRPDKQHRDYAVVNRRLLNRIVNHGKIKTYNYRCRDTTIWAVFDGCKSPKKRHLEQKQQDCVTESRRGRK
jgi:hypothetical protein